MVTVSIKKRLYVEPCGADVRQFRLKLKTATVDVDLKTQSTIDKNLVLIKLLYLRIAKKIVYLIIESVNKLECE